MQRNAGISGQLAQVLQAVVILALAMRIVPAVRRRRSSHTDTSTDLVTADHEPLGALRPDPVESDAGSAAPGIAAR